MWSMSAHATLSNVSRRFFNMYNYQIHGDKDDFINLLKEINSFIL